jgi:hypothetical protein
MVKQPNHNPSAAAVIPPILHEDRRQAHNRTIGDSYVAAVMCASEATAAVGIVRYHI